MTGIFGVTISAALTLTLIGAEATVVAAQTTQAKAVVEDPPPLHLQLRRQLQLRRPPRPRKNLRHRASRRCLSIWRISNTKRRSSRPSGSTNSSCGFTCWCGPRGPKFADFIGDYNLKNGPTRGGAAMTHQEFLNMVTPKELKELFGSTSSSSFAMFQAAVMNAAGQSLIKKAIQEIGQARDQNEIQAIRERIDKELAALLMR